MRQNPPYNLPSAWSPGLAVPGYIRREGLERHAFVTLEAPDGTYDDPAVGSGGYVVPQYVLDDGYGQGARTTKWSPRGSYFGPKIPSFLSNPPNKIVSQGTAKNGWKQYTVGSGVPDHPVIPMQGMGDAYLHGARGSASSRPGGMGDAETPMPAAYQRWGHQAAGTLIQAVQKLAPANRKKALQAALNKIDPSLWSRTAAIANRYQKQGMTPANALHHGLARAMSTGLAAELVHTGTRGAKPHAKGLLGLGCYGRAQVPALGDTVVSKAGITLPPTTGLQTNLTPNAGPVAGECTSDGQFIWDTSTGTGFWRRLKAGESCVVTGGYTVSTSSGTAGGVTVTDPTGTVQSGQGLTQAPPPVDPNTQVLQVGPFSIPLNVSSWTVRWTGQMPADWQAFILPELAHDCSNCAITSMEDATQGHTLGALMDFFTNLPAKVNKDLVGRQYLYVGTGANGIPQGQGKYVVQRPDQPIVLVKRPDNGDEWGVYMSFVPQDASKAWDSSTNPYVLQLEWLPKPEGVWDWIKIIVGAIVSAVGTALDTIGDLTCDLLQSPAGVVGGAAAGAAVGGAAGAQAGAAGAQIAKGACGSSAPPTPVVAPHANTWVLPVAIAGFGIAAILLMTPKHKKKTGTTKPGGHP